MKSRQALLIAALGTAVAGLGIAQAMGPKADQERCHGVVKAGKNDCAANGHGCAGQAKVDSDPNEWIALPKGSCAKIVGGSLTPREE